jgi:hypothetical protein
MPISYTYTARKSFDTADPNTRLSGATFLPDLPLEALAPAGEKIPVALWGPVVK